MWSMRDLFIDDASLLPPRLGETSGELSRYSARFGDDSAGPATGLICIGEFFAEVLLSTILSCEYSPSISCVTSLRCSACMSSNLLGSNFVSSISFYNCDTPCTFKKHMLLYVFIPCMVSIILLLLRFFITLK